MPNLIFAYPFTQMHELDDQPQCTRIKKKGKKGRNLLATFTKSAGKLQLPLSSQ